MKTAVLKARGELVITETAMPIPEADEVLLKVGSVGVCSSDIARGFGGGAYHYPLVMGHEFGGTVMATGVACRSGVAVGDVVAVFPLLPCFHCGPCVAKRYVQCESYGYYGSRTDGAYREFTTVKEWNLIRTNGKLSPANLAAVEPVSVVLHALKKIEKQRPLDNVLILGGGYLGIIAASLIRRREPSARVTIADRNEFKLKMALDTGAETILLDSPKAWDEFVVNHDAGFPIVIESSGAEVTFAQSLRLTARGGLTLWMGNIGGDVHLPKALVSSVLRKEQTILGTWNSDYDGPNASDWTEARDLLEAGFSVEPYVTREISLDELPNTLGKMYRHKERLESFEVMKVLVRV